MKASEFIIESGATKCWPGYRKTGTQSGTGKNAGSSVNKCKKIGEDDAVEESGLQYHTGVKKHGKEYMVKAAAAGRDGASQKELGALKDRYSKAYKNKGVAEVLANPGTTKKIQIRSRFDDSVLYSHTSMNNTVARTVLAAIDDTVALASANLRGADLRGIDLRLGEFQGADLRNADLRGADLRGTDLRDADLSGANMDDSVEEGVFDKVRAMNYDRLAKRSKEKGEQAFDIAHDYGFSDPERFSHEKDFTDQMAKMRQRTNKANQLRTGQGVAEGNEDEDDMADQIYAEFESMYPNLARRADERTVHAAIIDVLNYGGDNDPGALAADVARAVKQQMQTGVEEATGDKSFDSMMKTIKKGTAKQKTADRRAEKADSQQRARDAFGPNPAASLGIRKPSVTEDPHKEFDMIERIIEQIADQYAIDAELVWEDLSSLTDDELYVFAVTQPVNEDWQKANKRDKTDGMSRKAVNAYRRENPGSKLKTAVTTKPGKLKKGGKASKRRKSYCSRSRGQMKMHSISCAKTPDKAICKARRRWNC